MIAALLAVAAFASAAEPTPAVLERLAGLRQAFLQDAAPAVPADGLEPQEQERLDELAARIAYVQAGRLGYIVTPKGERVADIGAGGLDLVAELERVARILGVADKNVPAIYRHRRCPPPSEFRTMTQAACIEAKAGRWESERMVRLRRELGPVLDQLRARPDGPVALPLGHPLLSAGARAIPCSETKEERPTAANLESRLTSEWESQAAALAADSKSTLAELQGLAELSRRQEAQAQARRVAECEHKLASSECRQLKRLAERLGRRRKLMGEVAACLEKPETCGGLLCDFYSACSLPRALTAHSIAEVERDAAERAHRSAPSGSTADALRKAVARRNETEDEAVTELAVLLTAALGPVQAPVKIVAKALVKPVVRWANRGKRVAPEAERVAPRPAKKAVRETEEALDLADRLRREEFTKSLEKQQARFYQRNGTEIHLPSLPARYAHLRKPLEAVKSLMTNPDRVYGHLVALEREVKAAGSLEASLAKWESKHGFAKPVDLHHELGGKEWYAMLRDGTPFRDHFFKDGGHGVQTHRVQWHLVMREMEAHPQAFGELRSASELYRALGDEKLIRGLRFDERAGATLFRKDERNLWTPLFDSFTGNSGSPEVLNTLLRKHFPSLGS